MHVESGGKEYLNGQLITSGAGAMGLMQVMPSTYDELRQQYNLGDDPFDPHNNILAGAAYMREMYDIYGSPGFLAAYNAGPNRLDDYLSQQPPAAGRDAALRGDDRPQHRRRVSRASLAGRAIRDERAADLYPAGHPLWPRDAVRQPERRRRARAGPQAPVQVAQLPEPPRPVALPAPQQYALVGTAAAAAGSRFPPDLVRQCRAGAVPPYRGAGPAKGQWAIQVGAFASESEARLALGNAREHAHVELAVAHPYVASVHASRGVLWRARLTGLSHEAAVQACEKLSRGRMGCVVVSPESQM